jgi:ATP-binding protein involved in chromosome partitioning
MLTITQLQVEQAIACFKDPYLKQDWLSAGLVKSITITKEIAIQIVLGYPGAGVKEQLITSLTQHLQQILGIAELKVDLSWKITSHAIQQGIQSLPQVKNIIAVASGKGGVGKSTTAVNLALALQAEGAQVGLLDADIYGPSQPMMLGVDKRPEVTERKTMLPLLAHGLQTMSIGYLVDNSTAMVWRGPMVTGALQQLLKDTEWHELDYLIIDLPPGTGDIQLTLAQKIPVSGAVIITTPQDIALLDVRKALTMFNKVKVPILGIIENMSMHICGQCGHQEAIFGTGGGKQMAEDYHVPLLGQLPLDRVIREQTDAGNPTVAAEPLSATALLYREIARKMSAELSLQGKNYNRLFPKIVIE